MLPSLYLKLGVLVVAMAGAGYVAWSVRSTYAKAEVAEAVDHVARDLQAKIDDERQLRAAVEMAADERHAALLKSISILEESQRKSTVVVTAERRRDPKFYSQPLPEKGWEEWTKARALLGAALPASSSLAASSSSP